MEDEIEAGGIADEVPGVVAAVVGDAGDAGMAEKEVDKTGEEKGDDADAPIAAGGARGEAFSSRSLGKKVEESSGASAVGSEVHGIGVDKNVEDDVGIGRVASETPEAAAAEAGDVEVAGDIAEEPVNARIAERVMEETEIAEHVAEVAEAAGLRGNATVGAGDIGRMEKVRDDTGGEGERIAGDDVRMPEDVEKEAGEERGGAAVEPVVPPGG